MNMMLRRMMMAKAQSSSAFELIYNSSCGTYPESNDEWEWRSGYYNGAIGIGGRARAGDFIQLKGNHIYESQYYSPINHLSADKCSISVTVEAWEAAKQPYIGGIAEIYLTDGEYAVLGRISQCGLFVGNKQTLNTTGTSVNGLALAINPPQHFTFKIELNNGAANYYFNDELIYTMNDLYLVPSIPVGIKRDYVLQTFQNAIGFGSAANTTISNITYTEG